MADQNKIQEIRELGQFVYAKYGVAPSFESCRQVIYSLGRAAEPNMNYYSTADYHIKRLAKKCWGVITKEEMLRAVEKLWRD